MAEKNVSFRIFVHKLAGKHISFVHIFVSLIGISIHIIDSNGNVIVNLE